MSVDTTFFSSLKIKDGDTIKVPAGKTYQITSADGIHITGKGIHITSTGSGSPPQIVFHGNDWAGAFNIAASAKDITIDSLVFSDMGSKNLGVICDGSNIYLKNLGVVKGGGLGIAHGAQGLKVEGCYADSMVDRNFFLTSLRYASKTTIVNNKNVSFLRCRCNGSRYEHGIRCHALYNDPGVILMDQCILNNVASPQGKQALNLRDGKNFVVRDCTFRGKNVIGPLADANGGINDDAGPERDRKLALRLDGVTITGCSFTDWVILEAGVLNLHMEKTCVKAHSDGHVFEISGTYGPRDRAKGAMIDVTTTYTGGTGVFNTGGSASRHNLTLTRVTFNGSPVT